MNKFSIQFLGVGSTLANKNYNTNAVIDIEGEKYLMDCGITAPAAMYELGITTDDLEGVIISHIHADHVGGLERIGYEGMFVYNKKLKLFIAEELVSDLWNKTLAGGMEDTTRKKNNLSDYFDVITFEDLTSFGIESMGILPIKTTHVPDVKVSYSFLLDGRVFWSADMLFNKEVLMTLEEEFNINTYFHDCQLFYHPGGVHASLQELSSLKTELKEKIIIMHYGDNIDQFEEQIKAEGFVIARQFDKFEF